MNISFFIDMIIIVIVIDINNNIINTIVVMVIDINSIINNNIVIINDCYYC